MAELRYQVNLKPLDDLVNELKALQSTLDAHVLGSQHERGQGQHAARSVVEEPDEESQILVEDEQQSIVWDSVAAQLMILKNRALDTSSPPLTCTFATAPK